MATAPTTDGSTPGSPAVPPTAGEPARVPWTTVADLPDPDAGERPVSLRRVLVQLLGGIVVVLLVVTIGGSFAARRLAEREAVNDAATMADLLAEAVVQPALDDRLVTGDATARTAFDAIVRDRVLSDQVVHVKLWSARGTVLYADEPELIGRTFPLDPPQRAALRHPTTRADISDLDREENALDGAPGTKLVEVYRPVWTPSGQEVLFEIYAPYDQVSQRAGQLWRGFAGVTISSLLLFVVLLLPLIWHLASRVRRGQQQRELLLQRSVDASTTERRLIAANLHDGPVQELAAASFVVSAAATRAQNAGQHALERELREVAGSVRASIRALRSLLVDIYPANLAKAGLVVALADLAQALSAPGLTVRVDAEDDEVDLTPAQERLVYRVAQETLRNAAKHAAPCTVEVTLRREREGVCLEVADDGPGFDAAAQLQEPSAEHFGLRLLADVAARGGATLAVATAPGAGTRWRLVVPPRTPVDEDA